MPNGYRTLSFTFSLPSPPSRCYAGYSIATVVTLLVMTFLSDYEHCVIVQYTLINEPKGAIFLGYISLHYVHVT